MKKLPLVVSGTVFAGFGALLVFLRFRGYEIFVKDYYFSPAALTGAAVLAFVLAVWMLASLRD